LKFLSELKTNRASVVAAMKIIAKIKNRTPVQK